MQVFSLIVLYLLVIEIVKTTNELLCLRNIAIDLQSEWAEFLGKGGD